MLRSVRPQVSRLQFYAARGEALPFIATLQPRMVAAAAALQVSSELHHINQHLIHDIAWHIL